MSAPREGAGTHPIPRYGGGGTDLIFWFQILDPSRLSAEEDVDEEADDDQEGEQNTNVDRHPGAAVRVLRAHTQTGLRNSAITHMLRKEKRPAAMNSCAHVPASDRDASGNRQVQRQLIVLCT